MESVRYIHAEDGKLYEHKFDTPVSAELEADGSVALTSPAGRRLWVSSRYPLKGEAHVYLENRPPRGHKRRHTTGGGTMPRKRHRKRKHAVAKRNPFAAVGHHHHAKRRRHAKRRGFAVHRRRAHRNPPMRGIVGMAIQGVKDAAWITIGQVANRSLLKLVPALPATWTPQMQSLTATAIQAVGAIGVGYASAMVVGRDAARFVLGGALASALQNAVKAAVPSAAPLLGDYPGWMMGYAKVAGYDRMTGYARMHGIGPRALVGTPPTQRGGMGDMSLDGAQWAVAGQE